VYGFLCFYICALAKIIRHPDLICTEAAASIVALGLLCQAVAGSFDYRFHKKGSELTNSCAYRDAMPCNMIDACGRFIETCFLCLKVR